MGRNAIPVLIMSSILFICSNESDYLQDIVYGGLIGLLGVDRVIDRPWNRNFHWPRKKYPRNLGFRDLNFKHLGQKLPGFSSLDWRNIGLVVVAATKPDCFETYLKILPQIPASVPVVYLDGGDLPEIGGDLFRLQRPELFAQAQKIRPFDFVFKREMLEKKDYPAMTAPLPFAIPYSLMPKLPPTPDFRYDVSFWAVESDPIRTQALGLLENEFDCRNNGTTRNQVFKKYKRKGKFYLEELARCKVILNFRGVGWDTLRYWEVFGLGRFMISQKPQIVIPDNFEHGKEIIFCKDDLSDLKELCEYYLANHSEREKMADAGARKAREKHSDQARARFVLDTLKQKIGLDLNA
jgi:hypothetical protein